MSKIQLFQLTETVYDSGSSSPPNIEISELIPFPVGSTILGGGYTISTQIPGSGSVNLDWDIFSNGPLVTAPSANPTWKFDAVAPIISSETLTTYTLTVSYVLEDN